MISLPALDALLNMTAATLLLGGYVAIRRGKQQVHRRLMLGACACSVLFLVTYLVHHARVGSVRFAGTGMLRALYFAVLLPHTVLAAAVVPLAAVTLIRALRGRFNGHKAMARITLPVWLFVSFSGVVVYWMLYRL
jgi:putative membrane protein